MICQKEGLSLSDFIREAKESLVDPGIQGPLPEEPSEINPLPSETTDFLTDYGNAMALVGKHGCDLRYVYELGWLVWTDNRWERDTTGSVMRMAMNTVLDLFDEASKEYDTAHAAIETALQCAQKGEVVSLDEVLDHLKRAEGRAHKKLSWAINSQHRSRLEAMVALATNLQPVVAKVGDFDQDPWLLNVTNGTLDLRTGQLKAYDRHDLITKLAPISYDADAHSDVFDRFLTTITDNDNELAEYLQRAAGFSLSGLTTEEVVFLVLGPAATGKSTYVEMLLSAMGDYGLKASFDTFLEQRNPGAARPDLARLPGVRLAIACESGAGRRLDSVALKELSGGDTITCRTLYHEQFSFKPQAKIWLATNEAPSMRDDDSGLWRRIRRLPFEHVIPECERDPDVKIFLTDPKHGGPAVLAWAVQGCLTWQKHGMGFPNLVRTKTEQLRVEYDPIADFITDYCVLKEGVDSRVKELHSAYMEWAKEAGVNPISGTALGRRMSVLPGVTKDRDNRGVFYRGIGLKRLES